VAHLSVCLGCCCELGVSGGSPLVAPEGGVPLVGFDARLEAEREADGTVASPACVCVCVRVCVCVCVSHASLCLCMH